MRKTLTLLATEADIIDLYNKYRSCAQDRSVGLL
jgi:hypothetical protein